MFARPPARPPARSLTLALTALTLSACTPAPPPAETPAPSLALEAADPYATALAAVPAPGAWTLLGDDGTLAACFAPAPDAASERECQLSIICDDGTRTITVRAAHAPEELVVLVLFNTPETALNITARGGADGRASAELDETAAERGPLLDLLTPTQDRFAVEIASEITTYPWHDSIARALAACR